jgi:c(7)-type cytochrome triheme protein
MSGPRRAAVALTLAATLGGAAAAGAQAKVPADFAFPQADGSPGVVTFSHAAHMPEVQKCTRCHMRDFKMARGASGPITLEAKQEGKFCGACHDGKTPASRGPVFPIDECDRCHK